MIKPSVLQHFIRDWMAVRGLSPTVLENDAWSIKLPKGLVERLGREELILAFSQRALSKHPKSELATVGNPVFDRLLGLAREEGRIAVAYETPPSHPGKPPAPAKAGMLKKIEPGKPEAVYQGMYHFVFTITYPTVTANDEMEVVSVDGGSLDVLAQTPDLTELWGRLDTEPRKGRALLPPLPIPPRVMDAGLVALERRLRRRIKKILTVSEERLTEETKSIRAYYEQLIEEARNQSRRWSTKAKDREDRVRWLQLEWKRRIEEANAFWEPRVNARLVAIGIQMLPRVAYRYGPAKTPRKGAMRGSFRVWDEATQEFFKPYCEECGAPGLEVPEPRPAGGFQCAECAARPKKPTKGTARGRGGDGGAKKPPASAKGDGKPIRRTASGARLTLIKGDR